MKFIVVKIGDQTIKLTKENCTVFLFPPTFWKFNHVFVTIGEEEPFYLWNCQPLIKKMKELHGKFGCSIYTIVLQEQPSEMDIHYFKIWESQDQNIPVMEAENERPLTEAEIDYFTKCLEDGVWRAFDDES